VAPRSGSRGCWRRWDHELWLGDAAQIRASVVRRQKTDQRDAEHLLNLLLEQRFPRLWVPNQEERDVRQLLLHRHHPVRSRTQVKNQLQAMALNQSPPPSALTTPTSL